MPTSLLHWMMFHWSTNDGSLGHYFDFLPDMHFSTRIDTISLNEQIFFKLVRLMYAEIR
jgi:hypothetical protein